MPNWTTITIDDLKASGYGTVIDRADKDETGDLSPVQAEIENAVARVRRYVAMANPLDADPAKVPLSLRGVTVRMAIFNLRDRLGLELTDSQKYSRKTDDEDLQNIAERKGLVELPDTPQESPTVPVSTGNWNSENKLVLRTHPVSAPARQFEDPNGSGYANPTGPRDK